MLLPHHHHTHTHTHAAAAAAAAVHRHRVSVLVEKGSVHMSHGRDRREVTGRKWKEEGVELADWRRGVGPGQL